MQGIHDKWKRSSIHWCSWSQRVERGRRHTGRKGCYKGQQDCSLLKEWEQHTDWLYLKFPNMLTLQLSKMMSPSPEEEWACGRREGSRSRMQFCEQGTREFCHLTCKMYTDNFLCFPISCYTVDKGIAWCDLTTLDMKTNAYKFRWLQ